MNALFRIISPFSFTFKALLVGLAIVFGDVTVAAQSIFLQSVSNPDQFIRYQYSKGVVTEIVTDLDKSDATFRIVRGVSPKCSDCISLESVNFPGMYLRHQNYRLILTTISNDLDRADASFRQVGGLAGMGNSYESFNFPNHFIRTLNGALSIEAKKEDPAYYRDASFLQKSGLIDSPAPVTTITGRFTFSNFMTNAINVEIYKENGTMSPIFITRIPDNQAYTVDNVKIGDVFSFKAADENLRIAPYTITALGGNHPLRAGKRYTDAKGQRVNTKASEHSFDIFMIDPIYIDYTADKDIKNQDGKVIGKGGMRKQVFKSLVENDLDWKSYEGDGNDIALRNHFKKESINEGSDKSRTETNYSDQSFKQSFTGNIGVSAGNEKSGKGGASASVTYATEEASSQRNIYTYSRSFHTVYDIVLERSAIELTDEFKNAIKALPETPGQAYKTFIEEWGTHYPTRVGYGGLMTGVMTMDEKTFMSSKGWDVDLKGEVEKGAKVDGGFKYGQNKTFNDIHSMSKSLYYYKGGTGGSGGNWSVKQGTAQPLRIQLSRLHELLEARLFSNVLTAEQIDKRKKLLEAALTEYIGADYDPGTSLKPRVFRMSNVRWKMIEEKDGVETPNIFGSVVVSLVDKSPAPAPEPVDPNSLEYRKINSDRNRRGLPIITVRNIPKKDYSQSVFAFNRTDKAGSRVIAAKGYEEKTSAEITFMVPKAPEDWSKYFSFSLMATLSDYDGASANDFIGQKSTSVVLSSIEKGKQTIKLELRSDSGDIDVMADIEEIGLEN